MGNAQLVKILKMYKKHAKMLSALLLFLKNIRAFFSLIPTIYWKGMLKGISVFSLSLFQMTTIKRSCCWSGESDETSSRTATAHYLQHGVHAGISKDRSQQYRWAVNYTVVIEHRFIKLYNADDEIIKECCRCDTQTFPLLTG